ncbi:MAG: hypothetical protein ABI835_16535 [Chloroflexota bacterium]
MENAMILYVGKHEAGVAFAQRIEASGGFVYLPESLMQALGMYITYLPQVTVIDMALDYAQDVYDHLRSVDARPLLLLSDQRVRAASVYTLPSQISAEALHDVLERFGDPQTVPNGVYHTA